MILLVSKYGLADVLRPGTVVVDPSRVAAQIVSGIGFLGAGFIITRRGAIRGLTTAASVWGTAAIGMAAGAGLPLLALLVTGLHFVIVLCYTPLGRVIASRGGAERGYTITYQDGRGVLRELFAACTTHSWMVNSLAILGRRREGEVAETASAEEQLVTVGLSLRGPGAVDAATTLGGISAVVRVDAGEDEED